MASALRQSASPVETTNQQPTGEPDKLDRSLIVLAAVMVLGVIMSVLDATIVNVALDSLGRELRATLATVQWVITGYLLSLAIVIPITGWAIDRFGAKRVWMTSVTLFVIGSVLSGAAWSVGSLIVFRILQGLGGGMLLPTAMTILATAAGPARMGRVMSIFLMPTLVGPIFGPVIGGLLVQDASWRWIFYVNVPIGLLTLVLAARLLRGGAGAVAGRLDVIGLALISVGLVALIYGLAAAPSAGGFGDPSVYGWLAAGVVLLAGFVVHSLRTGAGALIDVRLFADRYFSAASATAFFAGFGLFAGLLLVPLYYQTVRGEGAIGAGLLLVPLGIGTALAMPLAGRLTDRFGARWVVIPGVIVSAVGAIAFTQVTATTPYVLLAGSLLVRGIGLGLTVLPAVAAAYRTLARNVVPQATIGIRIVQQVGGSFGAAVIAVVLQNRFAAALPARLGGSAVAGTVSLQAHPQVAGYLATAFAQTFWIALGMAAIMVVPALFLPASGAAATVSAGARDAGAAAQATTDLSA